MPRQKIELERQRLTITTPRVERAKLELLAALEESAKTSGMVRDVAAGKLAQIACEIWERGEEIAAQLPVEQTVWKGGERRFDL